MTGNRMNDALRDEEQPTLDDVAGDIRTGGGEPPRGPLRDGEPTERPEPAAAAEPPADAAVPGDGEVLGAGAPTQGQVKDPEEWVTGDDPMTDAQRGYLDSLAKRAGETLPADLTKAEASEQIERLQGETGTGQPDRGTTR